MISAVAVININKDLNQISIVRTADHFGIRRVFVVGKEPHSWKAAKNCHKNMKVKYFKDIPEFIKYLREKKYNLCVVELHKKAKSLFISDFPPNPCFVTGNESLGVDPLILDVAEHVYYIPQAGLVNCMNTAAAAACLMYKWFERSMIK